MLELLSIDLSNYCSKQCPFCYNHSTREGNVVWQPAEIIAFATDCVEHGIKAVSLGGGEPFEYDGVFDVIDALQPIAYLSVTTNGLPLEKPEVWNMLPAHKPDKIHITIHQPQNSSEVERVIRQVKELDAIVIKPGVNLLVGKDKLKFCKEVYALLLRTLKRDQIIMVPQRYGNTPTPKELAMVAGNKPFQSPSCLLGCKRPETFCSVSWDKKVNSCSYAKGKRPLETLNYNGLTEALSKVIFESCT